MAASTIGVIGAGAWGTALAKAATDHGEHVRLWAREPEVVASIASKHENTAFLPRIELPATIAATNALDSFSDVDLAILAVPAQFLRAVTGALAVKLPPHVPAVIAAKGIETDTGRLMSEIVAEIRPHAPIAIISGPSFAREVAEGLPAALTLACADKAIADSLAVRLSSPRLRLYTSPDIVGAQIGGAVKNVLAIACGIATGRGLGENARAALITRGMAEMTRLSEALGGAAETLLGLCGIGDVVLTCMSATSRNFSVGLALGEGKTLAQSLAGKRSVAEGVASAAAVVRRARSVDVAMPIAESVDAILNRGAGVDETIARVLARPLGKEEVSVRRA
ncbi:MAG TPA: NAD(P)H-dependent glycerol-3-phosphate dehydrogenase [Alphaproteobacteria bacterium]|jgi:glycerol-3-phosphate dehydrogenase (NAD(P)+)|nr:NAD(P)H-dependent glycerol-3-phosphate dehydrogenase [Alphaproteobacteria bacterium]